MNPGGSMPRHPAKFSDPILELLAQLTSGLDRVLDPFAGTGRIHRLQMCTVGVEIEAEWGSLERGTLIGNALQLPFRRASFDGVVTSPCYGNRMADHHHARDGSTRHTYRHTLGRELHPNNSGRLQWGEPYRQFHHQAWLEVHRVLQPGGTFIVNVSDHIRRGQIVPVSEWHHRTLLALGFEPVAHHRVATRRQRHGENGALRVDHENVSVFRRNAQ